MLGASTLILTDYQGLNVKQISDLRRRLREGGSGFTVVKNTLLKLAAADTEAIPLTEGLVGPTAVVYADGDPVAAAKALLSFGKEVKAVHVKHAMVDGKMFDADQVEALAKIPSRQELYAMVVGGLRSPITGLVGTLQSMISGLVFTLKAVAEHKQAA
ncbi:MAG: 50S ribosomal protein L10 [Armatimonadetes bacterium RBG_16_58_9]|nr:MAG: 50S ribosomal protein L10 [Armatimonadetes bacterium RBG_16_58_9]